MRFQEIIGNENIKSSLIKSENNNRIAHSYLFLGENGSSKLAIALAFAQYINCEKKSNQDSCGECNSCIKFNNLTHPDLHLIFPVLSIKNIKKVVSDNFVEQWREQVLNNPYLNLNNWFDVFSEDNKTGKTGYIYTQESESLNQKLRLKHYESEYRIVIIWKPEKMQSRTSNKLLKLLEEPPHKTIFLLVSENAEILLKTILSRLQIIKIQQHKKEDLKKVLSAKYPEKTKEEIDNIIAVTNGDLGQAIHLFRLDNFEDDDFEEFQKWTRICYSTNIQEITIWTNERSAKGRESQLTFLKYALKMIRNCLIFHYSDTKSLYMTDKEKEFLLNFHKFIHQDNIIQITKILEEGIENIERNGNVKIMLYELSLQMMRLLKVNCKFAS